MCTHVLAYERIQTHVQTYIQSFVRAVDWPKSANKSANWTLDLSLGALLVVFCYPYSSYGHFNSVRTVA